MFKLLNIPGGLNHWANDSSSDEELYGFAASLQANFLTGAPVRRQVKWQSHDFTMYMFSQKLFVAVFMENRF